MKYSNVAFASLMLSVFCVTVLFFSFSESSYAQEIGGKISVYPSKEGISITPGKSLKKTLMVVNSSAKAVTLKVSVRDFKTVDKQGTVGFYENSSYPATQWLVPQYDIITVPALDSKKMEYVISADANMPGRGYSGAITFSIYNSEEEAVGSPFGTLVGLNVISKDITTGGRIESFSTPLLQFTTPVSIGFDVKSTSNANLSLSGDMVFRNIFGKEVNREKFGSLYVYPGSVRNFTFNWDDNIFGIYFVSLKLADGLRKDNVLSAWTLLIALPWQELILWILAITAFIFVSILVYKKYFKKESTTDFLKNTGRSVRGWSEHIKSGLGRLKNSRTKTNS